MKHTAIDTPFSDVLRRALADLPRPVGERELSLLCRHWQLVKDWNRKVNLTAITDDEEAAWLHYRDSLEALSVLPPGPVVDLGSGAGFPGIPIAICEPDRSVTLVEPRRKRASFLQVALARLDLHNARVLQARAEDAPDRPYAAALTRATFSDEVELRACLAWVAPGGVLVAFRAPTQNVPSDARVHPYNLREASRSLLILQRAILL